MTNCWRKRGPRTGVSCTDRKRFTTLAALLVRDEGESGGLFHGKPICFQYELFAAHVAML